jgi:hypothetical protein
MTRGSWFRDDVRQTVETALALDIRMLAREGALRSDGATNLSVYMFWSWLTGVSVYRDGDERATIFYTRNGVRTSEQVVMCWTVPNYGGRRPWWRCPGCARRCAVLFHDEGRFRCRTCLGLTYTMSQLSDHLRPLRQSVKRQLRFGWEIGQPFPAKPPRMHQATWRRVVESYNVKAREAQDAFAPTLARWEAEAQQSRETMAKIARGELQ